MDTNRCRYRYQALLPGTFCLLIAVLALPASLGCSTSGGRITLIPNNHRLLPSTERLAQASHRCAPIPRELQKQALVPYYVQPGDVLLIEATDFEADIRIPADQTVMPDGSIDLDKYGRHIVAGMTIEQIESVVLDAVRAVEQQEDIAPVNVRLSFAESAVFYVLGEVNSPGSYPLLGRETVLDALMAAGGLSDSASNCEIILSRPSPPAGCRVVLPVCYDRIVQLGDTTTNYHVQPGDRIFVATRSLCEQLFFWHRKCNMCPDCNDRGCELPLMPTNPPFPMAGSRPTSEELLSDRGDGLTGLRPHEVDRRDAGRWHRTAGRLEDNTLK